MDSGQERVRDVTLECGRIRGPAQGHIGKYGLLGENFPIADRGKPTRNGSGAFGRTAQMPANRRLEPRRWASRDTPLTTGPTILVSADQFAASALTVGVRDNMVHSLSLKAGGATTTTYPK
jgi:hypothetical protein